MSNALTGSFDEIVFEGRNKAYGAFQLRRSYQSHLGRALCIAIAACSLLLLLPMVLQLLSPREKVASKPAIKEFFLKPQIYAMPTAKPLQPAAPVKAVSVLPHAVIPTRVAPDDAVKPLAPTTLPTDAGTSEPNATATGDDNTTGASTEIGTGPATATGSEVTSVAAPAVVLYAEVMPDFIGGRTALQRYLQKHLRFPAAALAAQVSGRVYVSFVVQTDGSIGDVTVLKGLGYGTEEAAARVVREMPNWTPGLQNRHAVPVRFTLPITFQFE